MNIDGPADLRERLGVPDLHLHDLRHAGNTFAAQSGASLRDLMVRMGHDSPAAALIYQHSSRASDEAIAAALDAQLTARLQAAETIPVTVLGPMWAPTKASQLDRKRPKGAVEPAFSAWEMPRAPGQQAG